MADDRRQPWRLPPARLATAHALRLGGRARMAAGVRAVVRTDAAALELETSAADEDVTSLDVVVDGELWRRVPLAAGGSTSHVDLLPGTKVVEVWLPQFGEVQIGPLVLHGATSAAAVARDGLRWITYGSSITQCRTAAGPSETWPALVARRLGWDLTCLGFAGECHLDPVVAQAIARTPADLVSPCLGINIYGSASFGRRTLPGQVSGFIQAIRDAHPGVPIASPRRERRPNAMGMSLGEVRAVVTGAVTTLQGYGVTQLHLIDGLSVFGLDDAHLLRNGLHPNAEGYRLMAERLMSRLSPLRRGSGPGATLPRDL